MNDAHRLAALLITLLGAGACTADVIVEDDVTNVSEVAPDDGPDDVPTIDPVAEPTSAYATRCDGLGELDIALSATGMEAYEGRAVWMSAVEAGSTNDVATGSEVVAFEQGQIEGGEFALSCDDSLTENYAYPSFTVVIDADGSGDCSAGDLAGTFQGYGWAEDQIFDLTPEQDAWIPAQWAEVGDGSFSWGDDFCAYYFDDVRVEEG